MIHLITIVIVIIIIIFYYYYTVDYNVPEQKLILHKVCNRNV